MRVRFNVSGTPFETSASTLAKHPDSMLAMLARRNEEFVDRDAGCFRWILYFYQSDILVDHTTVGVPEEVWATELDYFGIYGLIAEQKCLGQVAKRPAEDVEFEKVCKAKHEELDKKKDELLEKRRETYRLWLSYLMTRMQPENRTGYDFAHLRSDETLWRPQELRGQSLFFMHDRWNEFEAYCGLFGFAVNHMFNGSTTIHLPTYYPGNLENFGGKANVVLTIVIWRKDQ